MEIGKLPMAIVGITIAIIVCAVVLIPVVQESSQTHDTYINDGYTRMAEHSDETVITWTPSVDRTVIKINGEDYSLSVFPKTWNTSYSIAFADDFILRVYMDGVGPQSIQIWQSGYRVGATSTSTYTTTFTISSTTLSYNSGAPDATTSTFTHNNDYFVMDKDGDMIMKKKDTPSYLLEDSSIIYAGGVSYIDSSIVSGLYFEGTVNDVTVTPMAGSAVTVGDSTATYTTITDHIGLILLSAIQFDTTYNDYVVHQTYNYFLVPYEVTAEKAIHADATTIQLINVIPILVVISIVMLAVGTMIYTRK